MITDNYRAGLQARKTSCCMGIPLLFSCAVITLEQEYLYAALKNDYSVAVKRANTDLESFHLSMQNIEKQSS